MNDLKVYAGLGVLLLICRIVFGLYGFIIASIVTYLVIAGGEAE